MSNTMMGDRVTSADLTSLAAATVVTILVMFGSRLIQDGDPYWHIAAGRWILEHGYVPTTDPFSYTFEGRPWVAHEWLSEVLMALAYDAGGIAALRALFGVAAGVSVLLIGQMLFRSAPFGIAAMMLLFPAAAVIEGVARPQFLVLPLLIAWFGEIMRARENQEPPRIVVTIPIFVLWANLHGSFVLGLALLAPFALEAVVEAHDRRTQPLARWSLVAAVALAAAVMTPHGFHGLLFPFQLMSLESLSRIREWSSANFTQLNMLLISILAGVFVGLLRGVRVPPIRLLVLVGLLFQTLQHQRYTVLLIAIGTILLAKPLAEAIGGLVHPEPRRALAVSLAALVIFAPIATARALIPVPIENGLFTPTAALQAVSPELMRQPVLNEYGLGGYLIFRGIRPYIDGRTDLYGDAFVNEWFKANEPDLETLRTILDRHKIAWTILFVFDPTVDLLDTLPGWKRIYQDRFAVVHGREPALSQAP